MWKICVRGVRAVLLVLCGCGGHVGVVGGCRRDVGVITCRKTFGGHTVGMW